MFNTILDRTFPQFESHIYFLTLSFIICINFKRVIPKTRGLTPKITV